MPSQPLGGGLLGQARLGDEFSGSSSLVPRTSALPVTYTTVGSALSAALPVSYSAVVSHSNVLLVYYLVSPTFAFSINGDAFITRPDRIVYPPRPVVGRTLVASPIIQGYDSMQWIYTVLQGSEFTHLLSFYNPQNPVVTLVFPDRTGTWVQKSAVMHPPQYGERTTVIANNVILSFTRL